MAEKNDPVMAEVIDLLEGEPAIRLLRCLALTFLLSVSSLQFWFYRQMQRSNRRKSHA